MMPRAGNEADLQLFLQLEKQLLHTDFSVRPERLDELLADCFAEISVNGVLTRRAEVVAWLLHKNPTQRWELDELQGVRLDGDSLLLHYRARNTRKLTDPTYRGSRCSSLWQHNGERWQMTFHQATRISV